MPSNLAQPGYSPVMLARVAGVLALVGIVTGAFDMGYVRNVVLVTGDAAQTLLNLQSHESLFRLGWLLTWCCCCVTWPVRLFFF